MRLGIFYDIGTLFLGDTIDRQFLTAAEKVFIKIFNLHSNFNAGSLQHTI